MGSGTEHILVVEDDPGVRDLLVQVLSSRGYLVAATSDGAEALAHVEAGRPVDLVVSDVMMPAMSGPAMVAAMGQLRPGLRVLFLSGHAEEPSAITGLRPAHVAFLQKPFSLSALLTKVREALATPLP